MIRAHGALNVDLKRLGMSEMFSKPDDPPPGDSFAGRWMIGKTEASAET
ncbi:hypothetical protein [Sphingomonas bacterium]|nr:hypothetical protein [Sphingomonas bacterium]